MIEFGAKNEARTNIAFVFNKISGENGGFWAKIRPLSRIGDSEKP
jgi:hypothetical protein